MTYHRAGNQNKDDDDEMTRKQKWNETERERDERDIIALGKEDDKRSNYLDSRSLCYVCTFNSDISYRYRHVMCNFWCMLTSFFSFYIYVHKPMAKLLKK